MKRAAYAAFRNECLVLMNCMFNNVFILLHHILLLLLIVIYIEQALILITLQNKIFKTVQDIIYLLKNKKHQISTVYK